MLNGFALNSGVVNSSGVVAQYSYLPTTNAYLSVSMSENHVALLSASDSLGTDTSGYITKVAQVGTANDTLGTNATGTLSKVAQIGAGSSDSLFSDSASLSRMLMIGASDSIQFGETGDITIGHGVFMAASAGFVFGESAEVSNLTLLPSADDGFSLTQTASITRAGGLSVADTIVFEDVPGLVRAQQLITDDGLSVDASASLSWKSSPAAEDSITISALASLSVGHLTAIPDATDAIFFTESQPSLTGVGRMLASDTISFDSLAHLSQGFVRPFPATLDSIGLYATGALMSYSRVRASEAIGISSVADLTAIRLMGASETLFFDQVAALSNNVTAHDPEDKTMVREYQERTMVRA